jgi:site-specific DNA recombinase
MYAEAKGWTVITVYHLEGVSGKSVMGHAEAKRMLQDVAKGAITGLIFSKLARLARNTPELLEFAAIFEQHDADLISLAESTTPPPRPSFYTSSPQWRSGSERDRRSSQPARIRASARKPLNGSSSFGYVGRTARWCPTPRHLCGSSCTAAIETRRVKAVARMLNDRDIGVAVAPGSPARPGAASFSTPRPGASVANYTRSLNKNVERPGRHPP